MDKRSLVLAALAASGGAEHTPVQVQKLFFLLDKNIAHRIGGEKFHFVPHHYGPFDKDVFEEIRSLSKVGMAAVQPVGRTQWQTYRLTPNGTRIREKHFRNHSAPPTDFPLASRCPTFSRNGIGEIRLPKLPANQLPQPSRELDTNPIAMGVDGRIEFR